MDYTRLSLTEVRAGLDAIARDVAGGFRHLDATRLNWQPDAKQWSVAQCLEHLLVADRLMLQSAADALSGARPRSIWQRLPLWPSLFGGMLIRSMTPGTKRKFTASPLATPASSDIAPDVVSKLVSQHRDASGWVATLDEGDAARTIMTSPFVGMITYSVLDGCRLIVAHDRRHLEQALRVTEHPGFPHRTDL